MAQVQLPGWKASLGLAASVGSSIAALVAYDEYWYKRPATILLAHSPFVLRLVFYVELALATAGSAFWDLRDLDPGSLKRAAASVLVVLALVFPMAAILQPFSQAVLFCGLIAGLCALLILKFWDNFLRGLGMATAVGVGGVCFHHIASQTVELLVMIPLLFMFARELVGKLWRDTSILGPGLLTTAIPPSPELVHELVREPDLLEIILSWPGTSLVDPGSEEFKHQLEAFELACAKHALRYPFHLHLINLFRVNGGAQPGRPKSERPKRTQCGQYLFHGTTRDNARGILQNGFLLPSHAGMFGKGIYFADCPLKSWQYTKEILRNGLILQCWVELGNSRHLKKAHAELVRPPHRSVWKWLKREKKYQSVIGDDQSEGGALRAPEYVIYNPKHAEVDYICEVKSVVPGTPYEPRPFGP